MRWQTGIGDTQFLRSMIPHHSGAILMCTESAIEDPAIGDLCTSIIQSQQEEINLMTGMLQKRR